MEEVWQAFEGGVAGEVADAPVEVESELGGEGLGIGILSRGDRGGCRSPRGAAGQRPGPGPRAGQWRGSVFLRQRGGVWGAVRHPGRRAERTHRNYGIKLRHGLIQQIC